MKAWNRNPQRFAPVRKPERSVPGEVQSVALSARPRRSAVHLEDGHGHGRLSVINHANEYVNGNVHTNGMENFWSLLKRGLHGTYISVEPFHLFRYLDEQ